MRIILLVFIYLVCLVVHAQETIEVTDQTIKIGTLEEEIMYFAFAEGDKIIFNFTEEKNRELKEVEIIEYPSTSKFTDFKVSKIENKTITVQKTSIYKFRFAGAGLGGRICKVHIQRVPASEISKSFNTSIGWQKITDTIYYTEKEKYLIKREYQAKEIVPLTENWVNSGSNATLLGGKSRILIPVALPSNTVEWYYDVSSTRDEEEIKRNKKQMNLVGNLTRLLPVGGTALNIAVNMITKPPGSDYCDIYQLDYENSRLFEAKTEYRYFTEGTRKNITSGVVKIGGGSSQMIYLGIKNPDSYYGIAVAIEVVAIVLVEEWGIRDVKKYKLESRNVPVIQN